MGGNIKHKNHKMESSIEDQLKCAATELANRRNIYPLWVLSGKMTEESAEKGIYKMGEIVLTLSKARRNGEIKAPKEIFHD